MLTDQPNHPASLRAIHMSYTLCKEEKAFTDFGQPTRLYPCDAPADSSSGRRSCEDSIPDIVSVMQLGFETAVYKHRDPAAAMQHLLHCMMQILVVSRFAANDAILDLSVTKLSNMQVMQSDMHQLTCRAQP